MVWKKNAEFIRLFQEFARSYLYTPPGLSRRAAYEQGRQQGRRNFEAIAAAADSGEDVTEPVLLQLLPYADSATNRLKGAWIHITPCITEDLNEWVEHSGWTKPTDWPLIAQAILRFVRRCSDNPSQLSAACTELLKLPYSKSFQTEMLTPILNALWPNDFLLINNKSRQVINYFANTAYSQKLADYPAANATGHKLIKELARDMRQPGVPALRDDDLFDMFTHWLVAVKMYDFSGKETSPVDEVIEFTSDVEEVELQPEYTLTQCAEDTGFEESELDQWVRAINRKGQAIIQGPPGTGKTYLAEKIARCLIGGGNGFTELVQFHPAYSYEDFMQGMRPQTGTNGELTYPVVPGRFLEFCKEAESREDQCVLIIDEINRANLSQVFGELMYLLEYRDKKIPLAGSSEPFGIPENVRIIGTMNTADRSIALVDYALRRRFAFITLSPNYEVLRRYHREKDFPVEGLIKILEKLNQQINDPHYQIGISFFLIGNLDDNIANIWRMEIEPYLEEYFFDQPDKIDEFRWDKVATEIAP